MKRIESSKNSQVKQWKKLHSKKERDKTGLYLIEGFHLIEEALTHNKEQITELIVSENIDMPTKWNVDQLSLTIVTDEIIKTISSTETSQGIVAICKQSFSQDVSLQKAKLLLIDAVQDPGNLGTMIRTADAAGIDAVVVGDGSVDIYNPKVVRSTQGAIFHLPIIQANLFKLIQDLKGNNVPVFGTSLQNAVNFKEIPPQQSFALIVGNEGNGVNPELLSLTTQNLYIPIYGKSESLNVSIAAGVLLYHLR